MPKDDQASPSRQLSAETKFPLGQIVATSGIVAALTEQEIATAISRHAQGDWGDLCEDDCETNELALKQDLRLLSAYIIKPGTKIYVITEWDRSVTTVLLPEEY